MPPAEADRSIPSASERPRRRARGRGTHRDAHGGGRREFWRAIGLTVLGTAVPGAGLTRTRSRRLGWALLVGTLAVTAYMLWQLATAGMRSTALSVVTAPEILRLVAIAVVVAGVVWCGSIVLTAVEARPGRLDRSLTRVLALVTTVLVLVVGAGTFKVAEYATITNDTVSQVFKPAAVAAGSTPWSGSGGLVVEGSDPWARTPRVNILLLGSDAGVGREGTRTDSIVVASIDTRTGNTALISVPRNLERVPLPQLSPLRRLYPSGVYGRPVCIRAQLRAGDRCTLNAIWSEVDAFRAEQPGAYTGVAPGRDETRNVIAEITGLRIDHMVVIDLLGFEQLVDAMGGLEMNVKLSGNGTKLPIGGKLNETTGTYVGVTGFFEPGPQRLDGYRALWYARTRAADTDTFRQARQRCVIQAIVRQVNPAAMLRKYAEIARIARDNIYTDIPAGNLAAYVDLVERVQKAKITSISLAAKDGVHSGNPDYELVRRLVRTAIAPAPTGPSGAAPTTSPTTPTSPTRPATPATSTTSGPPYEQC